jgi:predicted transcriptional regulator
MSKSTQKKRLGRPPTGNTEQIHIRVTPAIKVRLDQIAADLERSLNWVCIEALERRIRAWDKES